MSDDRRGRIRAAVGEVLCNSLNFPKAVQARMLGQDMSPLIDKVTESVDGVWGPKSKAAHAAAVKAIEDQDRDGRRVIQWGVASNHSTIPGRRDEMVYDNKDQARAVMEVLEEMDANQGGNFRPVLIRRVVFTTGWVNIDG